MAIKFWEFFSIPRHKMLSWATVLRKTCICARLDQLLLIRMNPALFFLFDWTTIALFLLIGWKLLWKIKQISRCYRWFRLFHTCVGFLWIHQRMSKFVTQICECSVNWQLSLRFSPSWDLRLFPRFSLVHNPTSSSTLGALGQSLVCFVLEISSTRTSLVLRRFHPILGIDWCSGTIPTCFPNQCSIVCVHAFSITQMQILGIL